MIILKNTIDDVFTENPLMTLEKYKLNIPWISSANILQIHTKVAKQWEKYKNFRIQMCIVIIEEVQDGPIFIYNYDFNKDISLIKQENVAKTFIYVIDKDGHLIRVEKGSSECTIESSCNLSTSLQSIVFHLGIRGVDLLISGKTYSAQNYFKSYNDLLDSSRRLPICKYRVLLDQYYKKDVQFDPCEMLFARSIDIPKDKRQETIVKYNKLLRAQPENLLHKGLAKFLREYCSDTVINEYTNAVEDRYDIFVATEDDKVYIIELKWLGRSITSELNVFSKYNSPDRAIEGAYQLKKVC
uniref:hypothetical protein n=1 Tax=Clostridium sp. NkU-1 TaxID=1095009 RepID=UPI0006D071D4